MQYIRQVEERIASEYPSGEMRCPMHLSIGQECVPAVLNLFLDDKDFAVSTHRSHAHYLAKGGDLNAMIAELYGKQSGCSKGRGGSMHLIDDDVGFKGSTAIVGNTLPIGVGLALSKKIKKDKGIVVVYLGDGATEQGVFYESINFSVLKSLPVLFVCENNLYSVYSDLSVRQPKHRKIHEMVNAMGMHTKSGNGYDVSQTYDVLKGATEYVKEGNGAAFVELSTYRWREHCGPGFDNDIGYRTEQEFDSWYEKDPLTQLATELLTQGALSKTEFEDLKTDLDSKIDFAFKSAKESEFASYDDAPNVVYKL